MSDDKDRSVAKAILIDVEPQLFVCDITASCEFFTRRLGFKVVFIHGEPPFYAQVARDNVALNLRYVDAPLFDNRLRERESLLSASITVGTVDELRRLVAEFQAADVEFHQALTKEPWGYNFIVKDPDGNLLLIGAPLE